MPQHRIVICHDSAKSVEELFAVLADHNRLGEVLGVPVRRIRDGEGNLNGVGSVRRIGLGPLAIEETVTAVQLNQRIDYRISRGGYPIRNHAGWLEFTQRNGRSHVDWHIEFDSALPGAGPLLARALKLAIRRGLRRAG